MCHRGTRLPTLVRPVLFSALLCCRVHWCRMLLLGDGVLLFDWKTEERRGYQSLDCLQVQLAILADILVGDAVADTLLVPRDTCLIPV